MRCHADTLERFAASALPELQRDPVRNNVACTVAESRLSGLVPLEPDALWLRVVDGDEATVLTALRTPPHPLVLAEPVAEATPLAAVDTLVDDLLAACPDLPTVAGPVPLVTRFVDRWSGATGVSPTEARRMRLFRLGAVNPPTGVAGALRAPASRERDLLITWVAAFGRGAGNEPAEVPATVDRWLAREGALWIWDVDGEPVSMLGISPVSTGVARMTLVYTPPPHRGNGYASAAVAAASRWALANVADECMLYTDLANPTSNRIYQAIGYRPVGDATEWCLS